ncbi:MAG TPA: potassium channel protein [Blastocatellia bacterium]|nr:potassium channel protein [Blastocatellia bacterium]
MSSRKKFKTSVGAILGLLTFGTVGYKLLLHLPWFDCFYFTLYTITTIGFGEPAGMTQEARYFTALLIILGVGTIGYAFSAATQAIVESELLSTFGKRKMFKDINKLSGHYIVCGSGRIGSRVIREIARRGHDFVVIESDELTAERLMGKGYLVLMGDATNDDVLRAAGIERARGLVCAVSSDPDNLYITLTARDMNKDLMIVARANDESAVKRLFKAGADKVVSPSITGSNQMAHMLLRPAVANFIELATMTDQLELEMEQVEIEAGSPFVGCALKDAGIRASLDVIVIAIQREGGQMIFNPSADTVIHEKDALVAIGSHDSLLGLERMANPARSRGSGTLHRH